MNKIINVYDTERDQGRVIEVGLTTIDLESMSIIKTYSFPIKLPKFYDQEISEEIAALTGWTKRKLDRQGFQLDHVRDLLLNKYGAYGRLAVVDKDDELFGVLLTPPKETFNVSTLFKLKYRIKENLSLRDMLDEVGIGFEGKSHRASVDSFNIAKLFIKLMENEEDRWECQIGGPDCDC